MSDFTKLETVLDINFKDQNLLAHAFVHRSYINEANLSAKESNERLEFLGDSVLELATTNFLFNKYPEYEEGDLTALRASLVRGRNLALVASKLELGEYLKLSKGEENSGGRNKNYILANTTEALIGAIYIDQGYESAEKFILTFILTNLEDILNKGLFMDAKTSFQEMSQEHLNITPEYRLIEESGPDHKKQFKMGVYLDNELIAEGSGSSKQDAEKEAAEKAIEVKNWKS